MKLISGTSNLALARSVAQHLKADLTKIEVRRFADGEIFVEVEENVRGEDVFVLQSTSAPVNDNLMELFIIVDALRRGSARRITAVIPYFGYARQDRKSAPRSPISAKLVANILTASGVNRVLTLDLHSGQIQGFFDIPLDHLYAAPVFINDIKGKFKTGPETVVVSPDVGGVARARFLAKKLDVELAIIDKRRVRAGLSEVMNIIGEVKGRTCILLDDIVDSAGTLCNAAKALMDAGAVRVVAYCSHGVLSGDAVKRVQESALAELVITDSIEATPEVQACGKIRSLTVAPLLAEAMARISAEQSVSSLLD